MRKHLHSSLILLIIIVLSLITYETRLLRIQVLIKDITASGINYDAFREMRVSEKLLEQGELKIKGAIKKYPALRNGAYMNPIGYLTFSMMANEFHSGKAIPMGSDVFLRCMGRLSQTQDYKELFGYYQAVFADLRCFPVPYVLGGEADISYTDTWYGLRKYGGNRRHEGTDLMASNQEPGYFPIISMTDGIVENMGWLEKGGYRIGIRGAAGGYFYYAHLDSYAPDLKKGDTVIAGQLLGFMGDSGYGPEGTTGQFDVHLHLGIYVPTKQGDMSINPYWILKMLEEKRTQYSREGS